jgi:predicted  nucleic acid-binding Zn-ribbon protein
MQPKSLDDRVTLLENKMQGLDGRVGALETKVTELTEQFVQFRQEVRGEFSATREEMHALHAVAMFEMNRLNAATNVAMNVAIERSMSQARTLHEEVMARIKVIERG